MDSKFIEAHKSVLTELLDLALPPESIETAASGVRQFTRRFGFLDKPVPIRFRLLDAALPGLPGWAGLPDISLDAAHFAALTLPITRVFIIENEINFLTFPKGPVRSSSSALATAGSRWHALRGCMPANCTTGVTLIPTASPSSTGCVATLGT